MGRKRHIEEEGEGTENVNVTHISIELLGMVINIVHDKLFGIASLYEANQAIKSEEMPNM